MIPAAPSSLRTQLAVLASASLLALLSACGGGGGGGSTEGGTTPPPVSTTPQPTSVNGTVTGFGSIIIDGVRYDDAAARVLVDNGGTAAKSGALGDLKLGMSVDAKVENGQVTEVTVRAAVAGPISAIDIAGSSFTIFGQTVRITTSGATPTLFEGVSGLAGLAAGDRVEVHGTVDATRAIVATRVERKPREADEPAVRLTGIVTSVDATARTFRFNDLTISYASASVLPANLSLANGQQALVFGDNAPSAGRFTATVVRIKAAEDGAPATLGGRITAFTSLSDFSVGGVRVNGQSASVEGGVAADLVAGQSVVVDGRMTGGVLRADKIRIIKTPIDALASLKGEVTNFVSVSNFKLRGTTVDASQAAFVGGASADLGNGATLQVQGAARGDVFRAERVEFVKPAAAQTLKLSGEAREWNAQNRTFKLVALTVRLADNVEIEGGTLDRMASGRRVSVVGVPDANGVVQATKLILLPEQVAPSVTVIGGRASDVAPSSFRLPGGMTITHSSATVFEGGTSADIVNGALVFAKGRADSTGRSMFATWVEIVKGEAAGARVAGVVSDFVSLADFRVGGQRVDASGATLVDGQSSALGDGTVVMATGSLVERNGVRVFVVTKLRFM
jgi:hypothetical protein